MEPRDVLIWVYEQLANLDLDLDQDQSEHAATLGKSGSEIKLLLKCISEACELHSVPSGNILQESELFLPLKFLILQHLCCRPSLYKSLVLSQKVKKFVVLNHSQ